MSASDSNAKDIDENHGGNSTAMKQENKKVGSSHYLYLGIDLHNTISSLIYSRLSSLASSTQLEEVRWYKPNQETRKISPQENASLPT